MKISILPKDMSWIKCTKTFEVDTFEFLCMNTEKYLGIKYLGSGYDTSTFMMYEIVDQKKFLLAVIQHGIVYKVLETTWTRLITAAWMNWCLNFGLRVRLTGLTQDTWLISSQQKNMKAWWKRFTIKKKPSTLSCAHNLPISNNLTNVITVMSNSYWSVKTIEFSKNVYHNLVACDGCSL